MNIVHYDIADLKEYENNPRNNNDSVKPVADSIKKFGFLVPIVVDKNGVIIAGHTREKAAKTLGISKVPCIVADELTDEQIKAFRLVDNKTNEFSTWDFAKLAEELNDVSIDLSEYSFPDFQLDLDISDEDFIQGTEIVKERSAKTVVCPSCGEEFES